jgi:hypothetical protein
MKKASTYAMFEKKEKSEPKGMKEGSKKEEAHDKKMMGKMPMKKGKC